MKTRHWIIAQLTPRLSTTRSNEEAKAVASCLAALGGRSRRIANVLLTEHDKNSREFQIGAFTLHTLGSTNPKLLRSALRSENLELNRQGLRACSQIGPAAATDLAADVIAIAKQRNALLGMAAWALERMKSLPGVFCIEKLLIDSTTKKERDEVATALAGMGPSAFDAMVRASK